MPSLYIETFGCQMNEADSNYIAERAASAGYTVATAAEEANVVVLNTCTVRENAERRAYGRMNHLKALKACHPSVRLVITGCLAEQDRTVMRRRVPHVDAIFGTSELRQLGDQLAAWAAENESANAITPNDVRESMLPFAMGGSPDAVAHAFSHLRAFVTVQRGCSYYCTFCIVPHVRGRFDHRPRQLILEEVRERIAAGAREIMLVGQTVNAWRDPAGSADFGDLCRAVAKLDGLERLTYISPHPKDFTEKMLDDLALIPQLNPRFHLPLQSASDAVLRRMNRKYTIEQFDRVALSIRRRWPQAAITTDLIVGFPGETEADFEETLAYVRTGVFANAFAFIYSIRRGTPAARWEQIPGDLAHARFSRLMEEQNRVTRAYHDRKVGRVVRALVAGDSKKDPARLTARMLDNVTVIAPKPPDYPSDEATPHPYAEAPWLDIAIDGAHVWGCSGTIVARARRFDQIGSRLQRPVISLV
jgi:tRNA-2-methylthio-N6-dimethylallyladenosine synthase